jgi:hypothetical protein
VTGLCIVNHCHFIFIFLKVSRFSSFFRYLLPSDTSIHCFSIGSTRTEKMKQVRHYQQLKHWALGNKLVNWFSYHIMRETRSLFLIILHFPCFFLFGCILGSRKTARCNSLGFNHDQLCRLYMLDCRPNTTTPSPTTTTNTTTTSTTHHRHQNR